MFWSNKEEAQRKEQIAILYSECDSALVDSMLSDLRYFLSDNQLTLAEINSLLLTVEGIKKHLDDTGKTCIILDEIKEFHITTRNDNLKIIQKELY